MNAYPRPLITRHNPATAEVRAKVADFFARRPSSTIDACAKAIGENPDRVGYIARRLGLSHRRRWMMAQGLAC